MFRESWQIREGTLDSKWEGTPPCNFVECLARFILWFHIYRHAGLRFHGEFVLVDGDFVGNRHCVIIPA